MDAVERIGSAEALCGHLRQCSKPRKSMIRGLFSALLQTRVQRFTRG